MKSFPRIALVFAAAFFLGIDSNSIGGELVAFGLSVNTKPRSLLFFDPAHPLATRTIATSFSAGAAGGDIVNFGVAYGNGFLWALGYSVNQRPRPIYKIKPQDGSIVQTLSSPILPNGPRMEIAALSLAFGKDCLWAVSEVSRLGRREIYQIDSTNGALIRAIPLEAPDLKFGPGYSESGVAFGEDHLWFFGESTLNNPRPLHKVSVADGKTTIIQTKFRAPEADVANFGIAYGDGHLWAFANSVNGRARNLLKINPADGAVISSTPSAFTPLETTDLARIGIAFWPGR